MTAEKFHDALTLLPADLIAEVDRKRSGKPKVITWKRYAAMVACFTLVLCSGLFCMRLFRPKGAMESMKEAPAEAAVMQAAEDMNRFGAGSVLPETQAAAAFAEEAAPESAEEPVVKDETLCALPAAPAEENANTSDHQRTSATTDGVSAGDHTHGAAEAPQTVAEPVEGWCGNTTAVLYIGGEAHTIWGSDAIAVTDILINLDYAPEKLCRCMAEYRADTEMDAGYEIHLTESFVRFNGGQADLTQEQVDTLREIITALGG